MQLCGEKGDECKICAGSYCNIREFFEKCLRCKSENDPQCVINPQLMETKVCKNYNDQCFTHIDKISVVRDCLSERNADFEAECKSADDKCIMCSTSDGNVCNGNIFTMETCSECDSTKDEKCRVDPFLFRNKICSKINSTDREGCYLEVVSIFLEISNSYFSFKRKIKKNYFH